MISKKTWKLCGKALSLTLIVTGKTSLPLQSTKTKDSRQQVFKTGLQERLNPPQVESTQPSDMKQPSRTKSQPRPDKFLKISKITKENIVL